MSGGSYSYSFRTIKDLADHIEHHAQLCVCGDRWSCECVAGNIEEMDVAVLRLDFARLLRLVATAAHDIEWVDSCDYGAGREVDAIRAALKGVTDDDPRSGNGHQWENGSWGVIYGVSRCLVCGDIATVDRVQRGVCSRKSPHVSELTNEELHEWGIDWLLVDDEADSSDASREEFHAHIDAEIDDEGWWELRDELLAERAARVDGRRKR